MNKEQLKKIKDPKIYLENFTKIKSKKGGLVPFKLKPAQLDLFNNIKKYNRIIILKARQLGFSTAATGYGYHYAITNPGVTVGLVGYNMTMVAELLDKVKTLYRTTPDSLKPTLQYNSKYEISFPKLDSKILVLPNSENVGRGYTLNFCLLTELSSWEKAEEKMSGLMESIPVDGKLIVESCVIGNTIIFTARGPRYMKDIHDWNNNDLGFSHGKKINLDGHYDLKPTNTYYNSGIRKGFKIITKYGYELGMSSQHKLFILEEDKLKFVKAKDLKIGDSLAIKYGQELWGSNDLVDWNPTKYDGFNKQNIKLFNPYKITENLSYLIGLIIGDGYVYKNKSVTITTVDKEVISFLLNNNLGLKFYKNQCNYYHYRCSNQSFVEFLRKYVGLEYNIKAPEKEIPKIIFHWSRKNVVAFLQGLFDADGSCRKDREQVSFTTTSKKIVSILQLLLLNFGIISRIYQYNAKPSKKVKVWSSGYKLEISKSHSKIFLNKIGFRIKRKQINKLEVKDSYDCLQEYIPGIGKIIKRNMKTLGLKYLDFSCGLNKGLYSKSGNITYRILNKILEKCRNKNSKEYKKLKKLTDCKYFYDEIKEIIPIKENVYDFTVNDGHTVIYNGFVGHNTPRGEGNLFHRMWMIENEFIKKKYGWWWEYPPELMEEKKKTMGLFQWSQEYGCSFLSSGRPVFNKTMIKEQRKNILKVGDEVQDENDLKETYQVFEKDEWIIYKKPRPEHLYVCGVDVSEGIEGGDYSVAAIFDRKTGEEVAMYRGLIAPDSLGEKINKMGREYNNALMVVEINNHGLVTVTTLKQLAYPSLYFRPKKFETLTQETTSRIGWKTTGVTRPLLIDNLAEAVREGELTIHSKNTLDEMSVFIYDDNNNMVAQSGFHDDSIFSVGIAYQGFKILHSEPLTQINYEKHLPQSFAY